MKRKLVSVEFIISTDKEDNEIKRALVLGMSNLLVDKGIIRESRDINVWIRRNITTEKK